MRGIGSAEGVRWAASPGESTHENGCRDGVDVEAVVDGGVRLALDAADLPSRGGEPMAGCRRSRVIGHPASASLCSPQVRLTAPVYWIPLGPCVIIGYGVSTEPVVFSVERGGQIGGD